ncbi:beta-1,3-galactosyl-O-glycosyl-glycoprotein beta-1,6-N-acetylglucosaminyltransferase 4-like [Convolutriloba macropyga]|uniref:beta-1,3-galactosyl-O-glycosyl-glycoprotein beta-1,6-N-acetylglucosaminyltransferase 4-like n=1 Tax=Convolutriloba macropyga TaxID=536237 RepID=UPI003F520FE3
MMIYRPQNFYCFHVDTKAHSHFENQVRRLTSCFSHNVFVVTTAVKVKWGTYSVLEAELFCQRDLSVRSNKWKYVINLTGEEFPLVTNFGLVSVLRAINGANLILGPEKLTKKQRFEEERYPEQLPFHLTPYKSGVHYALTRKAVEFILRNKTARALLGSLYGLKFAEEGFFSTLQFNSRSNFPGGFTLDAEPYHFTMNSITRFKIWSYKKKRKICLNDSGSEAGTVGTSATAAEQVNNISRLLQQKSIYDANYDSDYDDYNDICVATISIKTDTREVKPVNLVICVGNTSTKALVDSGSVCTIVNKSLADTVVSECHESYWVQSPEIHDLKTFSNDIIKIVGVINTLIKCNDWIATGVDVTDPSLDEISFQS